MLDLRPLRRDRDDIYDGETIDARLASDAWLRPGFTDDAWSGVRVVDFDTGPLAPYVGPPVSGTRRSRR